MLRVFILTLWAAVTAVPAMAQERDRPQRDRPQRERANQDREERNRPPEVAAALRRLEHLHRAMNHLREASVEGLQDELREVEKVANDLERRLKNHLPRSNRDRPERDRPERDSA